MNEVGISWPVAIAILSLIISAVGGLIAVVWSMHNKRVDGIDKRVDANAKAVDDKFENQRQLLEMRDAAIFEKLDKVHDSVQRSATDVANLRAEIAQGYVDKKACGEHRRDCAHKG